VREARCTSTRFERVTADTARIVAASPIGSISIYIREAGTWGVIFRRTPDRANALGSVEPGGRTPGRIVLDLDLPLLGAEELERLDEGGSE